MEGPRKITIYNRTGWLISDPATKKGVFAYRDVGTNADGHPYDKVWFTDVYSKDKDKITGDKHETWNFQRVHVAGKSAFSKLGIQPHQLPMLIKLATLLYSEISGKNVPAPALPNPLSKPSEEEELFNFVMGKSRF